MALSFDVGASLYFTRTQLPWHLGIALGMTPNASILHNNINTNIFLPGTENVEIASSSLSIFIVLLLKYI